MEQSLRGKVAFITGAAHGQGRASALALAREGVNIIAFDIGKTPTYPGYALGSQDDLVSLKQDCSQLGVECLTAVGDVRVQNDIANAVDEGMKKLIENSESPEYVARVVLDAINDSNPKLRYLAGKDVEQIMEIKNKMSDEDFHNMIKNMSS